MLVSIILPTFNEKDNIIPLVKEINRCINNYEHEIIVADDNSPDGTYDALLKLDLKQLKPILRRENKGFANSIREGIEKSKGNIIIIMDSDFNHQTKYLDFMINSMKYYDCVSASRFVYGGKMSSKLRHSLSWLFNIFTRLIIGGGITDSLYGFYCIKREVLFSLNFNKIFWGYGDYCIRLFYYLQRKNIEVLQFPAVNGKRKEGKGNSNFIKVFIQYSFAVMKLFIKEKINLKK